MAGKPQLPKELQSLVKEVGKPVSSDDVNLYGRIQSIADESHRLRTILSAWRSQQTQDRKLRERYAKWLIIALGGQSAAINIVFILIGCGLLTFEPWTAKTFIMAVFAEIAAMVFLVVRYLFTPSGDRILDLIDRNKEEV
jgi:hypothetical protein